MTAFLLPTLIAYNGSRLNDSFYLRINTYKMKKTEGQIIAQEVWNMLTDNAKKEMKGLKKSFMESIAADVDAIVNKNFALADVSRCVCDNVDEINPYYDIEEDIFRCDKCDKHFC